MPPCRHAVMPFPQRCIHHDSYSAGPPHDRDVLASLPPEETQAVKIKEDKACGTIYCRTVVLYLSYVFTGKSLFSYCVIWFEMIPTTLA